MTGPICMSVGGEVRTLLDAFGPRCGKAAVYRTMFGAPVCEECGQRQKRAHESGETLLSVLRPGVPFTLDPIQ